MENQLFDWEQWDEIDIGGYQFYNVKLKVPIGKFQPEEHFDTATVDFQKGKLELFREENGSWGSVGEFDLTLSIKY